MSRSHTYPLRKHARLVRHLSIAAATLTTTCVLAQDPDPRLDILASTSVRMAPAAVFVNVTGSTAQDPGYTWHRSQTKWAFGDHSAYQLTSRDPRTGQRVELSGQQQGFNASYVYQRAGTYVLRASVQNGAGNRALLEAPVEIVPDTRTQRFVSSTLGSDNNDGLTPATAWATYDFAMRNATDDMRVRLRRGDEFPVDSYGFNSPGPVANFMLDSYGEGAKPILMWVDPLMGEIFNAAAGSENLIVRNIRFECASEISAGIGNAMAIGTGVAATVWDCDFAGSPEGRGFNRWIENHSGKGADGLLVLNCTGGVSSTYNFTLGGDEFVNGSNYVGVTTHGSLNEAVVRGSFHEDQPATRVNFQFCDLRNRVGGKESIRFQAATLGHIHRSVITGVQISHSQGPTDDIVLNRSVLISARDINGVYLTDNSRDVMVRNCVFEMRDDYRNAITTGSGTFEIGTQRIEILNNTFRNTAPIRGKTLIQFGTEVPMWGVRICNNLFVVPEGFGDRFFDMPSVIAMDQVYGNVFPDRGEKFAYAAIAGTSLSWSHFGLLPFVGIQARQTLLPQDVADRIYAFNPVRFRIAANAAQTVQGVFEDFHGSIRAQGRFVPWAAGAVDSRILLD